MGFWKKTGKVASTFINYRADKWIGADNIKEGFNVVKDNFKMSFRSEKAQTKETFEEACARLQITEEDLADRKQEFTRLIIIFLAITVVLFAYSMYLLFATENLGGFLITFALVIYTLANAFKFHFWLFQIKKRKLGCSLREWFNS